MKHVELRKIVEASIELMLHSESSWSQKSYNPISLLSSLAGSRSAFAYVVSVALWCKVIQQSGLDVLLPRCPDQLIGLTTIS